MRGLCCLTNCQFLKRIGDEFHYGNPLLCVTIQTSAGKLYNLSLTFSHGNNRVVYDIPNRYIFNYDGLLPCPAHNMLQHFLLLL
jgi:hypothetical protein